MNEVISCLTLLVPYLVTQTTCDVAGWGEWGYWTGCSVTCGYGTISRSRFWIDQDGQVSNFTYVSILECWTEVKCPVHGGWSMWSAWSPCTLYCGNGTMERSRECNTPEPSEDGDYCQGRETQTWHCNETPCPELPPDFDVSQCNDSLDYMCESNLQCVPLSYRCDGALDCHDGSDEGNCFRFLYPNASPIVRSHLAQFMTINFLTIVFFSMTTL